MAVSSGKIDGVVRELEKKEITGSLVFACGIREDCLFLRHPLIKCTYMKKKVLSVHILMVGKCARDVEWKCNGLQ